MVQINGSRTGPRVAVTLQDIADRCGVSKMTVSCALRGKAEKVSPQMMSHIRLVAQEMGYDAARNHSARRMALSKTGQAVLNHVIALFFPHEFYETRYALVIFKGILQELTALGYALLTIDTDPHPVPPPTVAPLPYIFSRGDVDGVIVMAKPHKFSPVLAQLRAEGEFGMRPVVSLISPMAACSTVLADDFIGGYTAATHLLELGHRYLMHCNLGDYPHEQRYRGHRQAVQAYGLDPDRHLIHCSVIDNVEHRLLAALAQHPEVTALLAPNDAFALQFFTMLGRAGIRVPEDMSLIGYDDTEELLDAQGRNMLTTVQMPLLDLGREAARLAVRRITGTITDERQLVLPLTLMVRGTSAPPRQERA